MTTVRLKEGTIFVVPLVDGGFAIGLIARKAPAKGKVWGVYGYFFGPFEHVPTIAELHGVLDKQHAKVILICGALHLHEGQWPVLGYLEPWNRTEWPLLDFVRFDEIKKQYYVTRYDEDNVARAVFEWPTEVPDGLLDDVSYGAEAAEMRLSKVMHELPDHRHKHN